MKHLIILLTVLLCLVTVLFGCQQSTDLTSSTTTASTIEPTTLPTTVPTTEPAAAPTTAPITEPTTEPTSEPEINPVFDISNHTIGSLEYSLLEGINGQRNENGLCSPTMDPTLYAMSAIRSYECSEHYSRIRPDGTAAHTVLSDNGYAIWSNTDERIHLGTSGLSANIIMNGWMRNDAFSAGILSESYTHIGIGVYTVGGISYITCLFAG